MKKFFVLIWLLAYHALAQDKQQQVALEKNEMILECVQLGEKGFILKTGNPTYWGKRTNTLLYYTAQGDLVWEKKIENQYQALKSDNVTVSAPDGSVVYNIEVKTDRFPKEKQYLTQINRKGEVKKLELETSEDYGKSLQSIFCDEQYLYYLTTENGQELHEKKKVTEKLILNRLSHADLSRNKIVLDLPAITDPGLTSFWSFAGQHQQEKYLLSKKINPESAQQVFDLITIDPEGKVIRKVALPYDSGDKYVRPATSISLEEGQTFNLGSRNLVDVNFEQAIRSSTSTFQAPGPAAGPATTTTSTYASANLMNGAFGYLRVDAANNALYVYGLLGPRPFRRMAPGYEGFYVYKFDLNGKEIWKLREPGSKELLDVKFYTTHGMPHDRNIGLYTLPNQKQLFSITFFKNLSFKQSMFLFDINEKGQVTRTRSASEDESGEASSAMVTVRSARANDYVKKHLAEKTNVIIPISLATTEGEILLVLDQKNRKLNVLFFKI